MKHEITLKLIYESPSALPPFFTDGKVVYLMLSEISEHDGVMVLTKDEKLIRLIEKQNTLEDVNRLSADDLQYMHDELCPLNTRAIGAMASKLSLFLAIVHARLDELKGMWVHRTNLN